MIDPDREKPRQPRPMRQVLDRAIDDDFGLDTTDKVFPTKTGEKRLPSG